MSAQDQTSDAVEAPETVDQAVTATEPAPAHAPSRGVLKAIRAKTVPIMLGIALVASAALATFVYLTQYRVDKETDPAAARSRSRRPPTARSRCCPTHRKASTRISRPPRRI